MLENIIKAVIVIVLGMLTKYCVIKMMGLFQAGVLRDMRKDTLNHIMKISPDFMERLSSDISDIALYMQTYLKDCIYVPIVVIVFAIYLFSLNTLLAAVCLIPLVIVVPLTIMNYYDKHHSGDVLKTLNWDANSLKDSYFTHVYRVVVRLVGGVTSLIAMLMYSPILTCISQMEMILFLLDIVSGFGSSVTVMTSSLVKAGRVFDFLEMEGEEPLEDR